MGPIANNRSTKTNLTNKTSHTATKTQNILDELEKEGQTIFYNAEGEPMPSLLREEMTTEVPDEIKKMMEEGLETEHAVRSDELKKKQEAIDNEIAILESEQIRMRKAKQVDDF